MVTTTTIDVFADVEFRVRQGWEPSTTRILFYENKYEQLNLIFFDSGFKRFLKALLEYSAQRTKNESAVVSVNDKGNDD